MEKITRDRKNLEKGLDPYLVVSDEEKKKIKEYNKRNGAKPKKFSNCEEVKGIWKSEKEKESFEKMFDDNQILVEEARYVMKVNEKKARQQAKKT